MAKHARRTQHIRKTFTNRSGKEYSRTKHPAHTCDGVILPSLMKERTRKIAASAAALAIAGVLAAPMPAWAAEWVYIDGNDYSQAASGAGSGGGSWSWDGNDDLLLDNYSGTGIQAEGDLDITLEGANKIDFVYDEEDGGIYVEDGDLTITGDGSLDVAEFNWAAIETVNGDISIEETTVNATAYIDDYNNYDEGGAINASNGNIDIIGSTVEATWNEIGSSNGDVLANAISATGSSSGTGTIDIVHSVVSATVLTPDRTDGDNAFTCAIGAYSVDEDVAPRINIDSSTVDASTPGGLAMLADNWRNGVPGTINVFNATLPAGVSVQDTAYGQSLGTDPGNLSASVYIESNVAPIEPVDPVEPAVFPLAPQKAYAATNDASAVDSALPTTGDAPTGIFAAIAAAITAAGATLFSWKKSKASKK